MIGRQISRYRIVEQIGSGGMSVVYKGVDTTLDREVAVKVLHPHLASKEDSRRRFSREAKAVAKLHHPNILEIYDFSGDDAPEAFIVTEYIRGVTLRTFAEQHRFDPPEIAAMAVHELASALDHAHGIGIIHRDLKPENVMIREDGVIKLMDFGIAKVLDRDERMTMTGALVGSPAHMAPEIIEGLEAGREADIFSLGTILYWLCCGKLPFMGNNTTQTLKLILDGTYPDPRLSNAAVSDELAAIMARCLARDPKDRYPGASELKEALARALNDSGIERPEEDLASFFADCDGYRARLQARLVTRLTARAEECAAAGKEAKALDCLSRVLSLQPGNPRATALIEAMKHRRKRVKQAKSVAVVAGVLVLLGGSGVAVSSVLTHQEEEAGSNLPPLSPHDPPTFITRNTGEPVKKIDDPVLPRIEPKESDVDPHEAAKKVPWVKKKDPREVRLRDTRKADVKVAVAETATGPLTIKSRPRGDIFLDSTLMNAGTPNFDGTAPVGKHHIRIEAPCCEIYERDVEVNAGGPDPAVAAALTPRPARLKVTAPHPVKVMVGSLFLGTADQSLKDPFQIKLPDRAMSGTVALSFFQEGYKPKQLSQTFEAGALLELPMELEKQ